MLGAKIRRLTALENFRLQGFRDNFLKPVSESRQIQQAGNSITVNVMQAVINNVTQTKNMSTKLKVATVCSGIGSPEQALKELGIEHEIVFACEKDKYARETYLANFIPNQMFTDMTTQDWSGADKYADLFIGGIPCFVAGTLITTATGFKNIEDIIAGDLVLTHEKRFKPVVIPMEKHSNHIYDLKVQGSPNIKVTGEHPFYVREMSRKWNNSIRADERVFSEPKWIDAKDLKPTEHFIAFGKNIQKRNKHSITSEECWLLGRYLADGYLTSKGKRENGKERKLYRIAFCIGKGKLKHFEKKITRNFCKSVEKTVTKAVVYNKRLHDLCALIGRGSENKQIPGFIMDLPIPFLSEFIEGYMSGDGCHTNAAYQATTVSKKLAYSLMAAVHKVYNTPVNITFCKRPSTCVIEGRTVNQKNTYMVRFNKEPRKQNNAVCIDNTVWQPVKKLTLDTAFSGEVYNFEVSDDNSYVADGCVVHNCQSFSLAGKRLGINDARGLLFYNFSDYVKIQQPKYFIIENVKGLLSDAKGRTFQSWLELLGASVNNQYNMINHDDSLLYNLHHTVLNSKNFGVPQNRERVFLIGIRPDLPNDFKFPVGEVLTVRLKDVLEINVDEKYYLSDKMTTYLYENEQKQKEAGNGFSLNIMDPNSNGVATTIKQNYFKMTGDQTYISELSSDDSKIVGYTRDKKGKITSRHLKDEANTIHTSSGSGGNTDQFVIESLAGRIIGRNLENPKSRVAGLPTEQMLEVNENHDITNTITTVQKDNCVVEVFRNQDIRS